MNLNDFAARGLAAQRAADAVIERHNQGDSRSPIDNSQETKSRPRSLNETPFLNRTEVRNFLLQYAAANRAHKFKRVSAETLRDINEAVRGVMISKVRSLPSRGQTI